MSARDGLLASGVGTTFAVLADLVVNGGDVVVAVFSFLLNESGLVYLFLSRLVAAAPNVAWLPAAKIQTAFTVVSLFLAVVALIQFARRAGRALDERL